MRKIFKLEKFVDDLQKEGMTFIDVYEALQWASKFEGMTLEEIEKNLNEKNKEEKVFFKMYFSEDWFVEEEF